MTVKADWYFQCPRCKDETRVVRLDVPVGFMEITAAVLGFAMGLLFQGGL